MPVLTQSQEDKVNARCRRRPEQGPQRRFVDSRSGRRIVFAMDAVHIRRRDRYAVEQRFARHAVVALRMMRGTHRSSPHRTCTRDHITLDTRASEPSRR